MGDNHERPRPGERAIQAIFQSLRIQCGEVLIQDRQLRILQQRSGKKNTAAFAVRDPPSRFAHHLHHSGRHAFEQVAQSEFRAQFPGFPQFFFG